MRHHLTIEELGDLVDLPIVATLATHDPDGSIRLTPVWHAWRDGGFDLIVPRRGVISRNIHADPRVSLTLYESASPWRGLELRTEARLHEEIGDIDLRMAMRYMGDRGRAYVEAGDGDQYLVRLEPGELRTWDFADDPLL